LKELRILPVVEAGKVLGVITRTDLMNILVGGPVIPSFSMSPGTLPATKGKKHGRCAKERLPRRVIELLKEFGRVADLMGFNVYLVGGTGERHSPQAREPGCGYRDRGRRHQIRPGIATQHEVKVRSHKKFGTVVWVFPTDSRSTWHRPHRVLRFPAAPPTVEMSSLKMDLYAGFHHQHPSDQAQPRDYGTLIDYFGGLEGYSGKSASGSPQSQLCRRPHACLRAIRSNSDSGSRSGN